MRENNTLFIRRYCRDMKKIITKSGISLNAGTLNQGFTVQCKVALLTAPICDNKDSGSFWNGNQFHTDMADSRTAVAYCKVPPNCFSQELCRTTTNIYNTYSLLKPPQHKQALFNTTWDLRFPQWWILKLCSSWMWRHVLWHTSTYVLQEPAASTFRVRKCELSGDNVMW
jgi:hypothetical protein